MGYGLEVKNGSKQQNKFMEDDTIVHPQASRRTKHLEKVKVRAGVGLAGNDFHHKARQDGGGSVLLEENSLGNMNRQSRKQKGAKVDELVKHMSNLPDYLQNPERGEKIQEKVLNFGVLDWSRLEKWKQKHSPGKGGHNTPLENIAAASTSSILVRPESRPDQQSSRCSSLKSSQKDVLSQGAKPSGQSVVRFQDCETPSKNGINGQKKIPFPYRSFGRNHSDIMLDKGKGKSSAQRISSEREAAPVLKSYGVSSGQKEDMSSCDSRAKKTKELPESDIKRKNNNETITSEMGTHFSKSQSSDVLLSSKGKVISYKDKTKKNVELPKLDTHLADQTCAVEENNIEPLPSKALPQSDSQKVCQLSKPRASCDVHSAEANKISFSGDCSTSEMDFKEQYSEVPHSCPLPSAHKRLTGSSCDIFKTSDQDDAELSSRRSRNPSPNRRFSFSLGRLGRSFSFKENSAVPQSSSTYMSVKSGPMRPETSDYSDNPKGEKTSSHNRGRSSPLRRLLEPILKHKEANPLHSAEAVKPLKASPNACISRPISVGESLQKEKCEASSVQALLQLTMKNGVPLFRFLVDRSSNCFVATMKSSSDKDDFGQNFTFYCVNEIKKKSGWMSQGSKGKSCGYAYNVVGQMKVSTSDLSDVNGQNFKHVVRESVLFSVELRQQANQEAPKFMLNRELAAAVVKIPSKDLRHVDQESNEEAMEKDWNKCSPEDSSIVILPGGVHSTPNKGEPSPLISRWKSGGSCDCGGWDVGCKLRVLSNLNKCCEISQTSTTSISSNHLELFTEGEAQENRAVFRLAPGKDGTYLIEFNTSISLLQAFFICVVVISSQKPSDISEAKVSQEPTLNGNTGIQVTGPSKYAPNPPHSPVGRV